MNETTLILTIGIFYFRLSFGKMYFQEFNIIHKNYQIHQLKLFIILFSYSLNVCSAYSDTRSLNNNMHFIYNPYSIIIIYNNIMINCFMATE